jgi:hypothetical protein
MFYFAITFTSALGPNFIFCASWMGSAVGPRPASCNAHTTWKIVCPYSLLPFKGFGENCEGNQKYKQLENHPSVMTKKSIVVLKAHFY